MKWYEKIIKKLMKVFDTRDINIETCSEEADILTKEVLPANLAESFSPIRNWRK